MPITLQRAVQAFACAAFLATGLVPATGSAQESMQTGDGLLTIKASMPETARVGETFSYDVEVMNSSDNVVLHDVQLKQAKAKGFSIESVSVKGQSSKGQSDDSSQNDQDSQANQTSNEQSSSGGKSMTIKQLMPGESRTITVKATADQEGELRSCLEIASYTPAMCLTSKVVKPELELTKMAPKEANRCNMIELQYRLKNGGSGDIGKLVVTDSLGEGLSTIEGSNELKFDLDGLAAGETREFVGRVYAKKTGSFSSRATAKASNSELQSRSQKTTTRIIAADLVANVNGPKRVYGNDLATFTATIKNEGNVGADGVNVTVSWPANANLADMSEYSITKSSSDDSQSSEQSNSGKSQNGQPTMAKNSGSSQSSRQDQNSGDESMSMQSESFVIDRLEVGDTAEFTYAIRTDNLDKLPTKVNARHVCTVDAAEDEAKSTAKTTAMAMATVKVVRLPALQLAVVDDEDPVKSDSKVQYTIQVWNEGDAVDEDVQLIAKLPNNLKFDSADGPTEVKSEGNTIEFAKIDKMQPGDRAEFTVTATPSGTGNARFEAALTSKMLQQEVIGEEPTRLFDSSSSQ
ncbi:COG1361 family protein [Neorhodopirellula pilleata]|uniref:Large cysteine-rich periplasmic protein omcB n=1 Tax=Neorhodopirellula pilleata TaxID=2714738 RepID=A0A5C6A9J2_9BACT|nr:DUF11 domain-containing protein [Neorhodopirellula pilleata]TWT96219.1 Large cysteine-rich periplasmic protein omcB precursor [Neorhodopirellula pilleata]